MITIDENSVERVAYLALSIHDQTATKEEKDEFMKLMYETRSIEPFDYVSYKTGVGEQRALRAALKAVRNPMAEYILRCWADEEDDVKPAAKKSPAF